MERAPRALLFDRPAAQLGRYVAPRPVAAESLAVFISIQEYRRGNRPIPKHWLKRWCPMASEELWTRRRSAEIGGAIGLVISALVTLQVASSAADNPEALGFGTSILLWAISLP